LTCEEALFGGAAGGGKTEALLMWLAEGIHIPGYCGVIFRRFIEDLDQSTDSLVHKTMRLYPALGGELIGNQWHFKTVGADAIIYMSGLAFDKSVLKAQGNAYHRAAFDELTHFTEAQYDFIYTTRMRKLLDFPIKCGTRCSANPGGPGHDWVKAKYISKEALEFIKELDPEQPTPAGTIFWGKQPDGTVDTDIAYVPSRAIDNPSLDLADYLKRMAKNKNPVEKARMMNGDWSVAPEGLIKPTSLRYYTMRGSMIDLLESRIGNDGSIIHTDNVIKSFHENTCRRYVTVDTAGGMKDRTREAKGKSASWTVAGVWDSRVVEKQILILRYMWRDRVGFTDVARRLIEIHREWSPVKTRVEDKTMGPDLANLLQTEIPIDVIASGSVDKVARAAPFLHMLDKGLVYLPKGENGWRPVLEAEWLGWQGLDNETNDIIDMCSYGAIEAGGYGGGSIQVDWDPRERIFGKGIQR
jgi:phage terminase large subunit-like protein